MTKYYTLTEAADLTGMSKQGLLYHVKTGKIAVKTEGYETLYDIAGLPKNPIFHNELFSKSQLAQLGFTDLMRRLITPDVDKKHYSRVKVMAFLQGFKMREIPALTSKRQMAFAVNKAEEILKRMG